MKKSILLLALFGALALALGAGLGLGATSAQAAELPTDDVIDCRGGHGGRGGIEPLRFFKDCAACDDPEAPPVSKVDFLACVEDKLADTDLTPERQAAVYDRVVQMLEKMEGENVICPERPAPKPRLGDLRLALRALHLECAGCESGETVTLEQFVACVTEKVNEKADLSDEAKAKLIEMAGKVPTDEAGNVLCPPERDPRDGPKPPGRGGRGR